MSIIKVVFKLSAVLSICLFVPQVFAQDTVRFELEGNNPQARTVVEVTELPDAKAVVERMAIESAQLQHTDQIVIASDLNGDQGITREQFLANPDIAARLSFLPMGLTEKISAVETLAEMNARHSELGEKTQASLQEAETLYRQKEAEYRRLRLPVTLVKMASVGVATFFIYHEKFNYAFLPTLLWAASTAAMAGSFQWKAPEINNDYRAIADGFFGSFTRLKDYAIPEESPATGIYKLRHQIIKRLAVIGVGGGVITTIYHSLGTLALFTIGITLAPHTLLEVINNLGFHYTHLSGEAIAVGAGLNVLFSGVKEILVDVVPSCLFKSSVEKTNVSEAQKRIFMLWGTSLIGGAGTVLVTASQLIPSVTLKIAISILTFGGAGYILHKYALKDIFSQQFKEEIERDFGKSRTEYFVDKLKQVVLRKEAAPARNPQSSGGGGVLSGATTDAESPAAPRVSKCRLYLMRGGPRTFVHEGYTKAKANVQSGYRAAKALINEQIAN